MAPDPPGHHPSEEHGPAPGARAFLGILTSVTSTRVTGILPLSPAADAGVRTDDVIESVDGRLLDDPGELQRLLQDLSPGDRVVLRLSRDGQSFEVQVTLAERPPTPEVPVRR
jgi:S1-C subfamily serine protease